MAIFPTRNNSELPSESQVEYPSRSGRRWPILAAYIIAALLVATGVVFAGKWVYRQTSNPDNSKKVSTSQSANNTKLAPTTPKKAVAPPPPSSSNNKPAPSPGSLPNNGPGEVVALFIGSSLAAAGLHFVISLRRF